MNSSLNDTGVGIVSVRLYPGFVRTSFEMNENGSTLSLYWNYRQVLKRTKFGMCVAYFRDRLERLSKSILTAI